MSPYKRVGKVVYKKVNGLKKKGKAKSVAKAKRYERLLRAVEHGFKPTGRPARKPKGSAWKGGRRGK